ncbi:N-6 DNA methylase [candidate division KSB1 bacterium]|nr:N-6 DNA methylase [candidate division KSB1 bacterium]
MATIEILESIRVETQKQLDSEKTRAERNKHGQFATPSKLASDILRTAKTLLPNDIRIRFLDPAFGTGAFYSALLDVFPPSRVQSATAFEVDPHYGQEALKLWAETILTLRIANFFNVDLPRSETDKANLIICNPPYVRHHHLAGDEKERLRRLVAKNTGIMLNGLAGFYCYFLLYAHNWLADGGLAGWLIPSEVMDVNYGKEVKQYLLKRVTLLRIHRFDTNQPQFDDALVSSTVVWFKKETPPPEHTVDFTLGGTLEKPEASASVSTNELNNASKWTKYPQKAKIKAHDANSKKLSDFFEIKRGLATGANDFFILTPEQITQYNIPAQFLLPILPSPRYLGVDEIEADGNGNPVLEQKLFLLACNLPERQLQRSFPALWNYFETGIKKKINERYICEHRTPWYAQEDRPPCPFLCTYMGRQRGGNTRPFRFILNHSNARAANVYLLLYPKPSLKKMIDERPELLRTIWQNLNEIPVEVLIGEGRVYGGGLHKMEPRELANAPAGGVLLSLPKLSEFQFDLFTGNGEE